ncbi:hypothetical protein [Methylomagnum sp.]
MANPRPLRTARQDMREQGSRWPLKNPPLCGPAAMEPFGREELARAARNRPAVLAE